ncbi:MAG: hypothetical protein WBD22_14030 [Pyrinomonadaceae bacterium]
MIKRNYLTAVVTLVLLSLTVFLFSEIRKSSSTTSVAQSPPAAQSTASLQRFSLSEMIDRSGRIFRGTVLDFEAGTVRAGGGELPTVTYRFSVDEAFKGEFSDKEGTKYTEITMLGNLKDAPNASGPKKLSALPKLPALEVGSDYLMLMTPQSDIGLSAPVGLGQGAFVVYLQDKQEMARNEFNNAGLFDGAVKYSELAAQIRQGGQR